MNVAFYIAAFVAVVSTIRVITHVNPIHALLYFVISLFSVALIFYILNAPYVAALEIILYAGAIMVLFIFVIMLLNLGLDAVEEERQRLRFRMWRGPGLLTLILIIEIAWLVLRNGGAMSGAQEVSPKEVGLSLFGPYILGVEVASMLLMTGLIGAYHLGRPSRRGEREDQS